MSTPFNGRTPEQVLDILREIATTTTVLREQAIQASNRHAEAAHDFNVIQRIAERVGALADIPTAGDISGLFERLHSIEEVILHRLGSIEKRLGAIEQQIGAGVPAAST